MRFSIRAAEPQDLENLLLLLPQFSSRSASDATHMPPPDQARTIFHQLLNRDGITMLIAAADQPELVVGTLTLAVIPNLTYGGRPWAIIENVVVDKACRRIGVGRRLVEHAIELAERNGCYKVQLLSGGRSEQLGFYAALGFESSTSIGHKRYFRESGTRRSSSSGVA